MAITNFIPEVWHASLLSVLDKSLVFGGLANRDYEGDISAFGDTVHITAIADPTISPYTRNTDLSSPEALTDSEQLLTIDQANSFNFQVDDIDKAQVRNNGALVDEATRRAGFGLRDQADQFLAKRVALGASSTNALGVIDGTTPTNVYDNLLVPAGVKMDEANVPEEMRWIVLAPAAYGKLQLDSRFIKANESGSMALHNGVVGDAAGFRIYKSNNAAQANRAIASATTVSGAKTYTAAAGTFTQGDVGLSVAGTGVGASSKIASVNADGSVATGTVNSSASATITDLVLSGGGQLAYFGSSIGLTYAQQILELEAYRPEKRFADALKGLHVFGGKVVRGTALGVASVKVS
jgi:hypothetical protein